MMLQQDYPDDFVLGTGESHTVREFAETAFKEIDMDLEWIGIVCGKSVLKTVSHKTLCSQMIEFFRFLLQKKI